MSRGILQDFVQDPSGNALVGVEVEVFTADGLYTTQAELWDAATGGNPVGNPLTTGDRGYFGVFADTAEYDLRITTSGGSFDVPNVPVFDADELTDLAGSVATAVSAAAESEASAVESAASAVEAAAILDGALQTVATLAELQGLTSVTVGDKRLYQGLIYTLKNDIDYTARIAADNVGVTIETTYSSTAAWVADVSKYEGYNIDWFGASPESGFDNSPSIQKAVNSIGGGTVYAGSLGKYEMASTVVVPVGITIAGVKSGRSYDGGNTDYCTFSSQSGGSYYDENGALTTTGYLFFMNVDPAAPSTWVEAFPGGGAGGAHHINIDGTDTSGICGFYFAGSYIFKSITHTKVKTLIRKPSVYTDSVEVLEIKGGTRATTTDYLVDLPGLGDALKIDDVAAGYLVFTEPTASDYTKGVNVGSTRGAQVSRLINGSHEFKGCQSVDITACHMEGGEIVLDSCNATVRGNALFGELQNASQIIVRSTVAQAGNRYLVTVEDNEFIIMPNERGGWPTSVDKVDIKIESTRVDVVNRNNRRVVTVSGDLTRRQVMGILVGDGSGEYASWTAYSHLLSTQGGVIGNGYVEVTAVGYTHLDTFNGFDSASATMRDQSSVDWTFSGSTNTYYYGIQLITDPIRLIGRSAATTTEATASAVNGGSIPVLVVSIGSIKMQGGHILRLYRGTATGTYNEYVDIPAIVVRELWDGGTAVNGFAWKSRTAGAMTTLNSNGLAGAITYTDGVVDIAQTGTKPTVGTWKQGDLVRKIDSTLDGNNMLLDGYRRLTNGAGVVVGTDWALRYISHVSPAT